MLCVSREREAQSVIVLAVYLYVGLFVILFCSYYTAKSDWDDGRWEWEDTPRREDRNGHSVSRRYQPSPSPMLVRASPDARLVSPWLDNTPRSAGNRK